MNRLDEINTIEGAEDSKNLAVHLINAAQSYCEEKEIEDMRVILAALLMSTVTMAGILSEDDKSRMCDRLIGILTKMKGE